MTKQTLYEGEEVMMQKQGLDEKQAKAAIKAKYGIIKYFMMISYDRAK